MDLIVVPLSGYYDLSLLCFMLNSITQRVPFKTAIATVAATIQNIGLDLMNPHIHIFESYIEKIF